MIRAYFENQVRQIEDNWLASVNDLENWKAQLPKQRWRLREMLGLEPLPKRTDLEAKITGTVEHPEFIVKKLHFQSMPGLYVTANLYVPKEIDGPLPGVLYVTGHANRTKDGVSLGSKTAYQRHPAWYARHGYVCLIIDTVQLGEIEGVHHGMYRMNRWWWWNRGYTPLGVEVWNSMRALDYLTSRPEVDTGMLAVTGRSGGGIYSWMLAALDDRITTAVPTAGITDLRNYILDGRVANHCDCMFMINTYRWDFPMVAALAAPRPMLLANGDHDPLFPIDGVRRLFSKTRQVYGLYEKLGNWNRLIVDAPHEDVPPLRQETYRWMHRHLKDQELTRMDSAKAFFDPVDLKVFDEVPADEINTRIDELFVEPAPVPDIPKGQEQWQELRESWRQQLKNKTFRGWPDGPSPLNVEKAYATSLEGLRLSAYDFNSQPAIRLRLWLLQAGQGNRRLDTVNVSVVGEEGWQTWASVLGAMADRERAKELVGKGAEATPWPGGNPEVLEAIRKRLRESNQALAVVAPRGIGPTAWSQEVPGYEVRRSFMLLGQTRDGMRVWDARRAVDALRGHVAGKNTSIQLQGKGVMAGIALYAGIFEPGVTTLDLYELPPTHRNGPILLNVRKIFNLPQALALAMADKRRRIVLHGADRQNWPWPRQLAERQLTSGRALRFVASEKQSAKPESLLPRF
jgi:dienelactone hydrolase